MIGQVAGSYRIVSKIAEGGMGVVYRAEHTMIGRLVAVKVLLPELSHQKEIVTRFFNEARAATAVRHPGIVEIFDFGYMPSGQAYIVMELLQGEPVASRLRRVGRMPEAEALAVLKATSTALAAAHAHGIVHRDLKPDNLFLCPDPEVPGGERPKLLDFGIAKLSGDQHEKGASLTRTGAVLGTPTYMSPEQCRGAGDVDQRSDLYALGCILYELVTGRPPFTSTAPGVLIANHLMERPEPPRSLVPELSAGCEAIILRLLAKKPDERYASATELAVALEALQTGVAPPASWLQPKVPGAFEEVETRVAKPPTWLTPPPMPSQHGEGAPSTPPTTLGAAAAEASPRQNRRGLAIGVGALAAVGAVVAAILILSSGGDGKAAGPTTPPPVTDPVPPPRTTPPPTTTATTTPPSTTTATPTTPPSSTTTTTPPSTTTTTSPPSTTTTTPPSTTTPSTTKPDPTVVAKPDPTVVAKPDPARPKPKPPVRPKPKPTGPIGTDVLEPTI